MSDKRIFVVSFALFHFDASMGHKDDIKTTVFEDEDNARNWLTLQMKDAGANESYYLSLDGEYKGNIYEEVQSESNPDEKTKTVTKRFCADLQVRRIDPEDLSDWEREYTVEMTVTRTYSVTLVIDEAQSEDDAEEKARDLIRYGEAEDQFDTPDDEAIDLETCYES